MEGLLLLWGCYACFRDLSCGDGQNSAGIVEAQGSPVKKTKPYLATLTRFSLARVEVGDGRFGEKAEQALECSPFRLLTLGT
jgi:hypothetical protein